MKCPRCGNDDPKLIGMINGRPYCRRCIQFKRMYMDEQWSNIDTEVVVQPVSYHLSFALSQTQKKISEQLIDNYERHINTVVMAVCGSGKTEMTYAVIAHVLNNGGRVCFAIPRRALCVELYERIKAHFEGVTIGLFYGGCQLHEEAPFVICTTHQLYRFCQRPFDLMLLDEADAFPYYGNHVLDRLFHLCTKKCYIKMSATLTPMDRQNAAVLTMNRRYHGVNLPVPKIILLPHYSWRLYLITKMRQMRQQHKRILIYVPYVKDVTIYERMLHPYFKVTGVSSHSANINDAISALRSDQIDALITTTILERGITIENVQVFVINASQEIYDERTLMQIAGRVGRSPDYSTGDIYFIDHCFSKDMKSCIKTIKSLNQADA